MTGLCLAVGLALPASRAPREAGVRGRRDGLRGLADLRGGGLIIEAICEWCTGVHLVTFVMFVCVVRSVPRLLGWTLVRVVCRAPRIGSRPRQRTAPRTATTSSRRVRGSRSACSPRCSARYLGKVVGSAQRTSTTLVARHRRPCWTSSPAARQSTTSWVRSADRAARGSEGRGPAPAGLRRPGAGSRRLYVGAEYCSFCARSGGRSSRAVAVRHVLQALRDGVDDDRLRARHPVVHVLRGGLQEPLRPVPPLRGASDLPLGDGYAPLMRVPTAFTAVVRRLDPQLHVPLRRRRRAWSSCGSPRSAATAFYGREPRPGGRALTEPQTSRRAPSSRRPTTSPRRSARPTRSAPR